VVLPRRALVRPPARAEPAAPGQPDADGRERRGDGGEDAVPEDVALQAVHRRAGLDVADEVVPLQHLVQDDPVDQATGADAEHERPVDEEPVVAHAGALRRGRPVTPPASWARLDGCD